MEAIHRIVGYVVVAVFTVGWVWGLGAAIVRRRPGERYWIWLTVAQVVALVQALIGVVLLLMGLRHTSWLNLVYGFGPLVIFGIGHAMARELQRGDEGMPAIPPWAVFAAAGFISFGLSSRALMTGLGVG
jgi:ABC-type transport system involved in multi-copper enzyme maturation permease subunit